MTDAADPKRILRLRFMNKVDEIDATWRRLRDAVWRKETLQMLQGQLRALVSSGEIFSFGRVTGQARACERLLEPLLANDAKATPEQKSRIDAYVAALKFAAADGLSPEPPPSLAAPGECERFLFLVMADSGMAAEVARRLQPFGYHAHGFSTLGDMSRAIGRTPPCIVLLDTAFIIEGGVDIAAYLQEIRAVRATLSP